MAAVDVVDREAELEEDEEDELLVEMLAALRRDQGEQIPAHTEFHHNVHIIALVEGCLYVNDYDNGYLDMYVNRINVCRYLYFI